MRKGESTGVIMDIHRMQELIRIYDEKLDTSDSSHVFEARWAHVTSNWIKSLDQSDRASVFAYIGRILNQAGESPQKLRTVMMLASLPCPETEMLTDKMLAEGTLTHTSLIMQYERFNKMLCEKERAKKSTE